MKLTGLHFLLTYQCTFECDHCFAWGSPWQSGTFTLRHISQVLQQAQDASVKSIYFEGGEPFLYYAVLLKGVQEAARLGFKVGIVSNAYWANDLDDALEWLKPFAGLISDLSVSSDLFHYSEKMSKQAQHATDAARQLGIPLGVISVAQPEDTNAASVMGQLPPRESSVMYRGRAVEKLIERAARQPWESFAECPHEDLREPGRVHLDPFGYLHVCQGISIGNLFQTPLREICDKYDADTHPIIAPLLAGGPAELARKYTLPHAEGYADACHLCYQARVALRGRFLKELQPDQMYGVPE